MILSIEDIDVAYPQKSKSKSKVKQFGKVSWIKEGKLAIDDIKFLNLEVLRVEEDKAVIANFEAHCTLIKDRKEVPVVCHFSAIRVSSEIKLVNDLVIDMDDLEKITTPGWMFELREAELASDDFVSDSFYVERGQELVELLELSEKWKILRTWIKSEMCSRFSL